MISLVVGCLFPLYQLSWLWFWPYSFLAIISCLCCTWYAVDYLVISISVLFLNSFYSGQIRWYRTLKKNFHHGFHVIAKCFEIVHEVLDKFQNKFAFFSMIWQMFRICLLLCLPGTNLHYSFEICGCISIYRHSLIMRRRILLVCDTLLSHSIVLTYC